MATDHGLEMIKCGLINIQSVGNKTFEIRDLINEENFDLFAVTETWLKSFDKAKVTEMSPNTHTFLQIPRVGKRGGGVGIFLSNAFKRVKICATDKFESFEHMQVACEISGKRCVFVVVYRPPNLSINQFINDFSQYLETIDMIGMTLLICE